MTNNETIIDRLILYIRSKGISVSKFERSIGAGNNYLNNVKSIGSDKLLSISNKYEDLNLEWLISGKGEMIKNSQHLEHVSNSVAIGRDANGSEIHISTKNIDDFIKISEKYQEHTDKMLKILEILVKEKNNGAEF